MVAFLINVSVISVSGAVCKFLVVFFFAYSLSCLLLVFYVLDFDLVSFLLLILVCTIEKKMSAGFS